jgi:hypothetical protein
MIEGFPVETSQNSSFSKALPGLQVAIDSTSLGEYKTCPRKYYYSVVCGYQPRLESVHLTFGLLFHKAHEFYHHGKSQGKSHDEALDMALKHVLEATWNKELGRGWASDHKTKNRATLIRTVVWYLDHYKDDNLETVQLLNGKPAVELSFSFYSGFEYELTGEKITFCGHLDRIALLNGEPYILDPKTTEHTISPAWFAKWKPSNQFSMYKLAGQVAFKTPVKGLIVDGIQVGVGFSRMERGLVAVGQGELEEWHRDTGRFIRRMAQSAQDGYWEMNDKACDMYGGCPFRAVCARPPGARQAWLDTDYRKRIWDPLQRRGDI